MIYIYRYLIYPLGVLILKLTSFLNKKVGVGFKIRSNNPWLNCDGLQGATLIHCSSGEFEYAKAVVRELKSKNQKIVVTYYSPTYESQIKSFPGVDFSCPTPWDCPNTQKEFLLKLKPSKILISRTDLWPEFLTQAAELKIPIYLFSATLSEKSLKIQNFIAKTYSKWIFDKLTHIFCVSDSDKQNFSKLVSAKKVTAIGDTRYDQVLFRLKHPKELKLELKPSHHKVFIAGSTWAEDETQLLPIFKNLLEKHVQIIIAPHEPTDSHLKVLEKQLSNLGIPSVRYSKINTWSPSDVLIVDTVGVLADLYAWCSWAFVGGSFRKTVHSVMEPLAQGCFTFFGPYHHNNREALEFKMIDGVACEVSSGSAIEDKILKNLSEENVTHQKNHIQNVVFRKSGASLHFASLILQ